VCDRGRPTTEKVRVVTERNQQVARIDYERDHEVDHDVEQAIAVHIARLGAGAQALLVSDYVKGAITRAVVQALIDLEGSSRTESGVPAPLIVDPKIPHLACYAGAALVTPNQHEAETATHMRIRSDADASAAAREFRRRAGCAAALVTRSEH